jgi:crotonobetainyl-CoA:carnitine CoA-transferase CaiB-like acyl-CoA transferase
VRPIDDWVARLTAAGAGAHRVLADTAELMSDPWIVEHGLSLTREHDRIGLVTTTGPAPRLSRTPVTAGRPAPPVGGDALHVLRELGIEDRLSSLPQGQGAM